MVNERGHPQSCSRLVGLAPTPTFPKLVGLALPPPKSGSPKTLRHGPLFSTRPRHLARPPPQGPRPRPPASPSHPAPFLRWKHLARWPRAHPCVRGLAILLPPPTTALVCAGLAIFLRVTAGIDAHDRPRRRRPRHLAPRNGRGARARSLSEPPASQSCSA